MWFWAGLLAFVACGLVVWLALALSKQPEEQAEEGPTVVPMPEGFRFLEEDGASDEAGAAYEASVEPPESEVLELQGDDAKAPAIAFLVGNPGCAHSYANVARCMQEELAALRDGRKATFYVVGLANFATRREYLGPPLGLMQETARVARALERVAPKHRESGFILVSHSSTCWCVLQYLLEALRCSTGCLAGARIPLVLFITPFLEADPSNWLQWVLAMFLRRWFAFPSINWVGRVFRRQPLDVKEWICKNILQASTEEDLQVLLTTACRQQHHLPGQLGLAADQQKHMLRGKITSGFYLMEELLREQRRPQVAAFYCERGDVWASLKHMMRLANLFTDVADQGGPITELGCLGDVEHEFPRAPEQSRKVAKAIAPTLAEAYKRAASCDALPAKAEAK